MTSITLPPNIDITDAYEEIQVLHSFRVESADGKVSRGREAKEDETRPSLTLVLFLYQTFLFYCDSEADKEVVVEAVRSIFSLLKLENELFTDELLASFLSSAQGRFEGLRGRTRCSCSLMNFTLVNTMFSHLLLSSLLEKDETKKEKWENKEERIGSFET